MADEFTINSDFTEYKKVFLAENAKLNLISKNDEKYLYEKHIYDSLSIKMAGLLQNGQNLLDIGCGGGFPCVPIAIEYPGVSVLGIDSIRKKINAINNINEVLQLKNLAAVCDRVENLNGQKFDIITSRAVANLAKISEYALPLLRKDGFFVAYKSRKVEEEIEGAKKVFVKYKAKIINVLKYNLPLDEIYERNLVIIGF